MLTGHAVDLLEARTEASGDAYPPAPPAGAYVSRGYLFKDNSDIVHLNEHHTHTVFRDRKTGVPISRRFSYGLAPEEYLDRIQVDTGDDWSEVLFGRRGNEICMLSALSRLEERS
jgi:hypothetical protein